MKPLSSLSGFFVVMQVLFLFMSDVKTIQWESDRICHYVISKLNDMKINLFKMNIEDVIGKELEDPNTLKVNTIKYDNYVVDSSQIFGTSHLSVDGTIAMMRRYGEFPIPEEVLKYLVDAFENDLILPKNFPQEEETFEHARDIVDAMIDAELPYYVAVALTGAMYVECGWNCHLYNKQEQESKSGVESTYGWANCGEGLFGLTHWSAKEKIIAKIGLNSTDGISLDKGTYNNISSTHLCSLDEDKWIEITLEFLKMFAKKHYDVFTNDEEPQSDDDYTTILSASYLWKAAPGLNPQFDKVKETAKKYLNTHKRQNGTKGLHDGFATQIIISIILDKYLHDELKIDLNDMDMDIKFEIKSVPGSDFEKQRKERVSVEKTYISKKDKEKKTKEDKK